MVPFSSPSPPLFPSPPLLPPPLAPCMQSHVMRHHSQLAVKPPLESLRHSHTPIDPAQPRDVQSLAPTGDVEKHIKRHSSRSVLPPGLAAMVTRDDLIGKVHTYEYPYARAIYVLVRWAATGGY